MVMKKKIVLPLIAVLIVGVIGCQKVDTFIQTENTKKKETVILHTPTTMELEVLAYMNEYRVQNGLSELTYNADIYECAKIRAEESLVLWSHTRPDGTDFWTVFEECGKEIIDITGENLANKFTDTKDIVERLINSEGHRENILNERFHTVCIAIIENENGKYVMAQLFMG